MTIQEEDVPPELQKLIKDILANDMEIKKVKRFETEKNAQKAVKKTKSLDMKVIDGDMDGNVDDVVVYDKTTKKPNVKYYKGYKIEKEKELGRQYLEEAALGNLKYKDKKGRNRTQTYNMWFMLKKCPEYDEENDCWIIPEADLFKPRVLAQKTVGSMFMKTRHTTLAEMQAVVTQFLNDIGPNEFDNLEQLLTTPKIASRIMSTLDNWYQKFASGAIKRPRLLTDKQRARGKVANTSVFNAAERDPDDDD